VIFRELFGRGGRELRPVFDVGSVRGCEKNSRRENRLVSKRGCKPGARGVHYQRRGVGGEGAGGGGGARNFWGISCEKSRFYAKKKSYFSQF
jgi:hypothetical protein